MAEELKLRPIYDALETHSYRKAIIYCDRLLKREPKFLLAKALKAQALCYQENFDQAEKLATEIRTAKPTDVVVLNNLALLYRNLAKGDQSIAVYEDAIPNAPRHHLEPVCFQWFMACVKAGKYDVQHKAAVKLNQTFKKKKYVMWTIMSLLSQAQDTQADDSQRRLYNALAGRMLEKAETSGDLDTAEGLWAYLQALERWGKFGVGTQLFTKPHWAQFTAVDPMLFDRRIQFLHLDGQYGRVLSLTLEKICTGCDDWQYYQMYADALLARVQTETDDAWAGELERVTEVTRKRPSSRSLLLWQLELRSRLVAAGHATAAARLDTVAQTLRTYLDRFGGRPSAFDDVRRFVVTLAAAESPDKSRTELLTYVRGIVEGLADATISLRSYLNATKVYLCLRRTEVAPDVQAAWLAVAQRLTTRFAAARQAALTKEPNADQDDCLFLAAQLLVMYYATTVVPSRYRYIYAALTLLECGLRASPDNFHFKLLAIRLYALTAAYPRALELYRGLDLKNVQHDSLSYWLVGQGRALGHLTADLHQAHGALTIYRSNEAETPDMLALAYRNGAYSQIMDFLEFQRRLDFSLQKYVLNTSTIRVELIQEADLPGLFDTLASTDLLNFSVDEAWIQSLSDNRDFSVLPFPTDRSAVAGVNDTATTVSDGGTATAGVPTFERRTRPAGTGCVREAQLVALVIHALHHLATHAREPLADARQLLEAKLADAQASVKNTTAEVPAEIASGTLTLTRAVIQLAHWCEDVFRACAADGGSDPAENAVEIESTLTAAQQGLFTEVGAWIRELGVPNATDEHALPTLPEATALLEICNVYLLALMSLQRFSPAGGDRTAVYRRLVGSFAQESRARFAALLNRCRDHLTALKDRDFAKSYEDRHLAFVGDLDTVVTPVTQLIMPANLIAHHLAGWRGSLEQIISELDRRVALFRV